MKQTTFLFVVYITTSYSFLSPPTCTYTIPTCGVFWVFFWAFSHLVTFCWNLEQVLCILCTPWLCDWYYCCILSQVDMLSRFWSNFTNKTVKWLAVHRRVCVCVCSCCSSYPSRHPAHLRFVFLCQRRASGPLLILRSSIYLSYRYDGMPCALPTLLAALQCTVLVPSLRRGVVTAELVVVYIYTYISIEWRIGTDTWKFGSLSFIFTHPPEDKKIKLKIGDTGERQGHGRCAGCRR